MNCSMRLLRRYLAAVILLIILVCSVLIFQIVDLHVSEKQALQPDYVLLQKGDAEMPDFGTQTRTLGLQYSDSQERKPGSLDLDPEPKTENNGSLDPGLEERKAAGQEAVPVSLKGLIGSVDELKGRHSDYVMPKCQPREDNKYNWSVQAQYDFLGPFDYLQNYKNPCWLSEKKELHCVPYFYLIGTPKAGSTDLFERIVRHPDVLSGKAKEIRWFDRKRFDPSTGLSTFQKFLDFFAGATKKVNESVQPGTDYHHKIIGDGGPTYYFSSYHWQKIPGNEWCDSPRVTAISHIHHLYPKAKLIMILRNPTNRLYSVYHFNHKATGANRTAEQFHEWLLQTFDVWNNCLRDHPIRYCMYDTVVDHSKCWTLHIGLYGRYILDILKIFPREQILFVHMEDYSVNTANWMRKIFKFLDLAGLSEEEIQKIVKLARMNKTKNKSENGTPPMLEKSRKLLDEFYEPFNRETAAVLQDDMYLWANS